MSKCSFTGTITNSLFSGELSSSFIAAPNSTIQFTRFDDCEIKQATFKTNFHKCNFSKSVFGEDVNFSGSQLDQTVFSDPSNGFKDKAKINYFPNFCLVNFGSTGSAFHNEFNSDPYLDSANFENIKHPPHPINARSIRRMIGYYTEIGLTSSARTLLAIEFGAKAATQKNKFSKSLYSSANCIYKSIGMNGDSFTRPVIFFNCSNRICLDN